MRFSSFHLILWCRGSLQWEVYKCNFPQVGEFGDESVDIFDIWRFLNSLHPVRHDEAIKRLILFELSGNCESSSHLGSIHLLQKIHWTHLIACVTKD